jgi:hypothetical protein
MKSQLTDAVTAAKQILKRNAAFLKANKARRRVLIAKDVLAQLELGKYQLQSTYLVVPSGFYDGMLNQQVMEQIPNCNVCGIGAAFCSALRLGNDFEMPIRGIERFEISTYLEKYFDVGQINLIEAVFENFSRINCKNAIWRESKLRGADGSYGRKNVAVAIFQNIIDNKGTFRPVL